MNPLSTLPAKETFYKTARVAIDFGPLRKGDFVGIEFSHLDRNGSPLYRITGACRPLKTMDVDVPGGRGLVVAAAGLCDFVL